MTNIKIIKAKTESDFAQTRVLFEEYAVSLNISLCFQNFAQELNSLDTIYCFPTGSLLVAYDGDNAIGCVAVKALNKIDCEIKRLYVKPTYRNIGLGKRLVLEIIYQAKLSGYQRVFLDTLISMERAQSLYKSLGFKLIDPYYTNSLEGVTYMMLELRPLSDVLSKEKS